MAEPYITGWSYTIPRKCTHTWTYRDISGAVHSPIKYTRTGPNANRGRELIGTTNPKWKAQVLARKQAGTSLYAYKEEYHHKPGYAMEVFTDQQVYHGKRFDTKYAEGYINNPNCFILTGFDNELSELETKANNEALSDFIQDARSKQHRIQGGVMIGELTEAIRMIKHPARAVRRDGSKYLSLVKKRGKTIKSSQRNAKKRNAAITRMISDSWLEYTFGIAPFLNDIEDGITAIRDQDLLNQIEVHNVRGYSKFSRRVHSYTNLPLTFTLPGWRGDGRTLATVEVIYKGQLGVANNAAGYAARSVGLDWSSFVPTVYEIIPYSFMIDYFSNLGEIVSSASFNTSDIRWAMRTVRTTFDASVTAVRPQWSYNGATSYYGYNITRPLNSPPAASLLKTTVQRDPYSGSFVPPLEIHIPTSVRQWANLGALFIGGRRVQKFLQS